MLPSRGHCPRKVDSKLPTREACCLGMVSSWSWRKACLELVKSVRSKTITDSITANAPATEATMERTEPGRRVKRIRAQRIDAIENEEPRIIRDALNGPEGGQWRAALDKDIQNLLGAKVFRPQEEKGLTRPLSMKPVDEETG